MKIQDLKTNCDWALYYRTIGWSPFPVTKGDKKPLIEWRKYQTEIATEEEIRGWWRKHPDASIGIATGKVSGIVVVDVEAGGSTKDLSPTVIARTGGGGFHFFYKHPGSAVKNRVRIREKTDIRADGGYVVVAPSVHRSGKRYEWTISPENAGFDDLPKWVLEECSGVDTVKTDWGKFLESQNSEGTRNQQAAKLAGKILHHMPTEMWDLAGLSMLKEWNNTKNNPPLPGNELGTTWESIKKAEFERRNQLPVAEDSQNKYLFTSLSSLLDEPEEDISWIVEGILPSSGLSVVAAKPKVGKSTLARQLGLAVAQGVSFLGRQTTKGPVLYVALEEKRSEVKNHFKLLGGTGDEDLYLYVGPVPSAAHQWLEQEIKNRKPILVIIDTLFRFVTVKSGNDYAEVTAALSPVLALARDNGAHLMVIHHAGKNDRDGGDSILGSTAIFGSVDTAVILKKSSNRRTIESQQRYGEDIEPTVLVFDTATHKTTLGGTKEEEDVQKVENEIVDFLFSQTESCTERTIEDAVEGRTGLKHKALRDLVTKGLVNRTGGGRRNDPYHYSCSLVPDIDAGREKQETSNGTEVPEGINLEYGAETGQNGQS